MHILCKNIQSFVRGKKKRNFILKIQKFETFFMQKKKNIFVQNILMKLQFKVSFTKFV